MRRTTVAVAALAAALALPAAAAAKGASKASLQGPSVKGTLAIPGDGEAEGPPSATWPGTRATSPPSSERIPTIRC